MKLFAKCFSIWLLATVVAACVANLPTSDPGHDKAKGQEELQVDRQRALLEHFIRKTEWTVERYREPWLPQNLQARAKFKPYAVTRVDGNLMLNEGINEIWTLVAGAGGTAFNNANARCGVGDSSAAEAASQTDLQAATNKLYKAQNASYPQSGSSQQIVFRCDYTSAEANFAWNEFTVDNGSTPTKNLNRKVSAQGTKASGQTWTLTLTITLS